MSLRFTLAAATALSAVLAGPAFAADDGPTTVDELIVSATRIELPREAIAATIEVIDTEAVTEQVALGASTVDVVSTLLPSFSPTRQKLSGFGESLRGRSPLYLIDGVPQSTPLRDDSRDGYTIDPLFIERIEVVFGSNAIQGIGATGGAVNYVTVAAPDEGEGWGGKATLQSQFGDELGDSVGWRLGGYAGRDFGRFDVVAGAVYETRGAFYDADGRRIGLDGAQGEIQDSKAYGLFAKAGVDFTDTRRLQLMLNHFRLEGDGDYVTVAGSRALGRPTTSVRGITQGDTTSNQVSSAALTYTDDDLFGGKLRAQGFAHDYHGVFGGGFFNDFQDPRIAPAGSLFDQSANNSEKLGLKLDWERAFGPGRVLVGVDFLRDKTYQELIQTGRLWVPETTYESVAPFIQGHLEPVNGLHLSGGLRFEDATLKVDDYTTLFAYGPQQVAGGEPGFDELLGNFGATYEVVPGLTAYAAFAQGFNMPDVGRVLRGVNRPGVDVDTFLDVSPVISDNIEIGADFQRGPVTASAAYFWSNSDKGALLVLNGSFFEVQRQRTEIEGLELSARWRLSDWVSLGGAYARLKGRTDSNADGVVDRDLDGVNIAPDRLNLWIEGRHGDFSARLQGQRYFARDYAGNDPRNSFEGYTLADLLLSWDGAPAQFTLGVQNLFNADYVTYFSDVSAPTDDLRYFFGRGRTFTIGVHKTF